MSPPDAFIRDINAQKVSAALLGEVMTMWASLSPEEWEDFDRKLQRVVDFIDAKAGCENSPMLAMAVALRLMALDGVVMDPQTRGWLMSGRTRDGITYLHGDLLKVAADEVILEGPNGEAVFNRETFRARLMELAATRGRA